MRAFANAKFLPAVGVARPAENRTDQTMATFTFWHARPARSLLLKFDTPESMRFLLLLLEWSSPLSLSLLPPRCPQAKFAYLRYVHTRSLAPLPYALTVTAANHHVRMSKYTAQRKGGQKV